MSTYQTIGILGGMGPEATALIFDLIIKATPAKKDTEHLPAVIYNSPQIPDRTAAITGRGPSPVPKIIKGLQILKKTPACFVIIPCNTVFHFFSEFSKPVDLPIVHIVMPVIQQIENSVAKTSGKVGVLGTDGTKLSGIYDKVLQKFNYTPVYPADAEQDILMKAIYQIKAGNLVAEPVLEIGKTLLRSGASKIILGCTELSIIYDSLQGSLPVVDSSRCLANAAVEIAMNKKPIGAFLP